MTRKLSLLFVAVFAAIVATVVPAALNAPEADAQGRCPAVVVVSARGSGQNNDIRPTSYSGASPWVSNGWEGETIRGFLQTSERRYAATHGGASLMNDVQVLGLGPQYYPATYPYLPAPDVAVPQETVAQFKLVMDLAIPTVNIGIGAANQFADSVSAGRAGVIRAIDDYQADSGCAPQYVLVGFSQGAMILAEHERELARRGQLAGVVYMGNPMTSPQDRSTVGNANGSGGVIGWLPLNSATVAATGNRVNYCLPLDGVCDASPQTLRAAEGNGGNHGRYFLAPSPWDAQVADAFGSWVDQVRYR